ncbi:MAG: hypothetical protein KDA44_21015 [Planctomycetales bacterium]|nr:hypothetical protein [Planctomycetales bacterium]
MELIAQHEDRRFWFLRLEPPYDTPVPDFGAPFVAVVVACDSSIAPAQQANISAQLVANDCRYMLAWGINATSWDDSVDIAFIETDPDFNPPDDRHVMTTWHDNETIHDVVWFALMNTNFDSHDFQHYLALMIGTDRNIESELITTIQKQLVPR